MPDKIHIFIGQVWKHKNTGERVCIGGIQKDQGNVWVSAEKGIHGTVTVRALVEHYDLEEGWKFD